MERNYFKEAPVTMVLITVNVAIFVLMMVFPPVKSELVLYVPQLAQGSFWMPVTSMFAHTGVMHLAMNMFSLFFLGTAIEPLFGRCKFAILYFASGLMGSFFSIAYDVAVSGGMVYLGASGAIFGLFAAYGVLLVSMYARAKKMPTVAASSLSSLKSGLINFGVLLAVNIAFSMTPGIGWQAHLGGFIGGAIVTGIMMAMKKV